MDGASSGLLEAEQIVGAVGEPAAVHIDARDSCRLPRVTGGLKWHVVIHAPGGGALAVDGVIDLRDGTSRVLFTPRVSGTHTLDAALDDSAGGFRATFDIAPPVHDW